MKTGLASIICVVIVTCCSREPVNRFSADKISIGEQYESPFKIDKGIWQDGTVAMYRVGDTLWALAGQNHLLHLGVFKGTSLDDLTELYPAHYNFPLHYEGTAFDGIKYPEGVRSRGVEWPFGLYIDPGTGRFWAFFHNESAWGAGDTGYDATGYTRKPLYDSDFRHVGLMHSDDQGRNWEFDRWVLTSENVCFTERFNPDGINVRGQQDTVLVSLGAGDFTTYFDDEYIYLFYNIVKVNMERGCFQNVDTYVARTRKRDDGIMGDFVKYYNGSFCEPGNFGKETAVSHGTWHSRISYSKVLDCYVMSSTALGDGKNVNFLADYVELRTSDDLLNWSEPISLQKDSTLLGSHYNAVISYHATGDPAVITGNDFTLMCCKGNSDVFLYDLKFEK